MLRRIKAIISSLKIVLPFPYFPSDCIVLVVVEETKANKSKKKSFFLSFIICLSIRLLWKNITMTSNFVLLQECNTDFIEENSIIRRRFLFCPAPATILCSRTTVTLSKILFFPFVIFLGESF